MITLEQYLDQFLPQNEGQSLRVRVRGRVGTVVDAWDGSGRGMLALEDPLMLRVEYDDTTVSDEMNDSDVEQI